MLAAECRQVALARQAALVVRRGVVEVAPGRWPAAAGEAALGLAELHQAAQSPGGLVAAFRPLVAAGPGLQERELAREGIGPGQRVRTRGSRLPGWRQAWCGRPRRCGGPPVRRAWREQLRSRWP